MIISEAISITYSRKNPTAALHCFIISSSFPSSYAYNAKIVASSRYFYLSLFVIAFDGKYPPSNTKITLGEIFKKSYIIYAILAAIIL